MKSFTKISFGVLLIALTLTLSNQLSAKKIYKWVDENGKVHYSDRPINENAESLEIKDKITPEQQQEARNQAQKLIQLQKRRVGNELSDIRDKKRAQEKADRESQELKQACKQARQGVKILEYQAPVFEEDGKGNRRYMEDKERQQELTRLKSEIAKHCNDN